MALLGRRIEATAEQRQEALEHLRQTLYEGIEDVIRYGTNPPRFAMVIDGEEIAIGGFTNVSNPGKLQVAFGDIGILLEKPPAKLWGSIVEAILMAARQVVIPEEDGGVSTLVAYIDDNEPVPLDTEMGMVALRRGLPLLEGKDLLVSAANLALWVNRNGLGSLNEKTAAILLAKLGGTPVRVVRSGLGGGRTFRRYWRIEGGLDTVLGHLDGAGKAENHSNDQKCDNEGVVPHVPGQNLPGTPDFCDENAGVPHVPGSPQYAKAPGTPGTALKAPSDTQEMGVPGCATSPECGTMPSQTQSVEEMLF